MSYCTIEEAWGLSEPFADEPPKSKRRHKKRHRASSKKGKHHSQKPVVTHHTTEDHADDHTEDHADDDTMSTVEEPFINSPSNISYEHPSSVRSTQQQLTTFSRSMEPQRVPDAIDVSMGGAPFEAVGEDDNTHSPDGASSYANVYEPPTSTATHQLVPVLPNTHSAPRGVVHEELEWMRNNMSHINDKIDKLTESLEARQAQAQQARSTTQAHDTLVFMLVGVFVLVLIDIFFRAGKRVVGGV